MSCILEATPLYLSLHTERAYSCHCARSYFAPKCMDEVVSGECPSSLRRTLRRLAEQYLAHFEAAESFSRRDLVDGQRHRVQAARALVCMSTAAASQLAGKHRRRLPDAGHLPQHSEHGVLRFCEGTNTVPLEDCGLALFPNGDLKAACAGPAPGVAAPQASNASFPLS